MTPQDIITAARYILNDTDSDSYRNSTAELLEYVNGAVEESSVLAPEYFSTVVPFTCTAGTCDQTLSFNDAIVLVEVLGVPDGAAVIPFDFATMNAFNPGWRTDDPGVAVQWSKYPDDPLRFFIYPKAPTGQTLNVRYTKNPTSLALNDTITDLPPSVKPALVDYVVYRAEAKDDESVNSGRAVAFYQSFQQKLKG